jgi:hypothetical protein
VHQTATKLFDVSLPRHVSAVLLPRNFLIYFVTKAFSLCCFATKAFSPCCFVAKAFPCCFATKVLPLPFPYQSISHLLFRFKGISFAFSLPNHFPPAFSRNRWGNSLVTKQQRHALATKHQIVSSLFGALFLTGAFNGCKSNTIQNLHNGHDLNEWYAFWDFYVYCM